MPTISIIIPTFNSAKTLAACLDSIVCQTFQDFEVWLIDGVSKDNTLEIIKEYEKKHTNINYISEPDKGIYDAMNKGIDLAKGEWLYFLGSDDELFDKNVLGKVANHFEDWVNYLYGNVYVANKYKIYKRIVKFYSELLTIGLCHQSVLFRKNSTIFQKKYKLEYPIHSDLHMSYLYFRNEKNNIKHVNLTIAKYSNTGVSSTNTDTFFHDFLLVLMKEKNTYNLLEFIFYKYHVNKYLNRKGIIPFLQNSIYIIIIKFNKLMF